MELQNSPSALLTTERKFFIKIEVGGVLPRFPPLAHLVMASHTKTHQFKIGLQLYSGSNSLFKRLKNFYINNINNKIHYSYFF